MLCSATSRATFGLPVLSCARSMHPTPTGQSVRLAAFPPHPASVDPASLAHVLHLRPSVSSPQRPQMATGTQKLSENGPGESRPSISNIPPHTMRKRHIRAHRCRSQSRSQVGHAGRRQFHDRPGMSQVDFKIGSGRRIFGAPVQQAHHAAFSSEVRRTSARSSAPLAMLLRFFAALGDESMRSAGRSRFPALCPAVPANAECLLIYLTGQNQRAIRAGSSSSEQSGAQATSALSADAGAAVRSADDARLALGASTSAVSL